MTRPSSSPTAQIYFATAYAVYTAFGGTHSHRRGTFLTRAEAEGCAARSNVRSAHVLPVEVLTDGVRWVDGVQWFDGDPEALRALRIPLDKLDVGPKAAQRLRDAVRRYHVAPTVRGLTSLTRRQLQALPGLGPGALKEIEEALGEYELTLRNE